MGPRDSQIIDILRQNTGFARPERWIEYARSHGFRRVRSTRVDACPDCGAGSSRPIGQFVYYSTLIRLRLCRNCRLAFCDVRIDPAVTAHHFEAAYKDERYFQCARARVFRQLAELVDASAPPQGRVLDVGGAVGHLLAAVGDRRPDLELALVDVSAEACARARRRFGIAAACGGVAILERSASPYDVVVLSDVLYYEPDLARLWRCLPRLLSPTGTLILRVPHRLWLIRLAQLLLRAVYSPRQMARRDRIPFFNPEHLYAFTPRYLLPRLEALGLSAVAMPGELGVASGRRLPAAALFALARRIWALSRRRWILTPSTVVVATRSRGRRA